MTPSPDLKRVQAALTKAEHLAKQLAVRLQVEQRKNKKLILTYKELERENQRLKTDTMKLKRDLKQAIDKSIWAEE